MRNRRLMLPAVLLTGALALGACSSDGSTGSGTPDATGSTTSASPSTDASASAGTTVPNEIAGEDVGFSASGAFGEKPTLTFETDTPAAGLQVAAVSEGDGDVVEAGDFVVAHYLGQIWGTETVFDTSYDRGAPSGFSLDGVIDGWSTGLVGQKIGSRVLLTIPPDLGYGPVGGSADGQIGAEDTIVFVVDVVDAIAADAGGQADAAPTGAEVPVSIEGEIGSPIVSVTVADGAAEPTENLLTVLATGTGPVLTAQDQAVIQYTLTTWDNSGFETTWPSLDGFGMWATALTEGSVFEDFVGVPVGSRVLLQLPGDESAGSAALAIVFDIVSVIS